MICFVVGDASLNTNNGVNGNIRQSQYQGNYANNFGVAGSYQYTYIYDNSNRLLKAENDSGNSSTRFDIINGYDKDGNFTGMKRYGSSNNLADNFSYQYFSGTNRLKKVSAGLADDYTYDNNGNMISDQLNRTGSIKYDHRNLMTEIRAIKTEAGGGIGGGTVDVTYLTQYRYDEAGNRVRKTRWKYTGGTPDPIFEGDSPSWSLQSDEFYVRDVSGKEIAIYSGSSLTQWNIWGLDNEGKINADTTKNYYLKDHLGSIRVVLNSTNTIISAQDYDAWGYPLENRIYQNTNKYSFVSSELDKESDYTDFIFRKYSSRIGRFLSEEPIIESSFGWSNYVYCGNNPIKFIDPTGTEWYYHKETNEWEFIENAPFMVDVIYDRSTGETTTNITYGRKELLVYNGAYLNWLTESGGVVSYSGVSGKLRDGNTQPEKQYVQNEGPIPEGQYTVNPNDSKSYSYGGFLGILRYLVDNYSSPETFRSWGYSWTLIRPKEGTFLGTRQPNMYIHGGFSPGSIGCIDLTSNNDAFHGRFLHHNKILDLVVSYKGLK